MSVPIPRRSTAAIAAATALIIAALSFASGNDHRANAAAPTSSTWTASAPHPVGAVEAAIARNLATRIHNPDLGNDLTGLVTDAVTGRTVWSKGPATGMMPASTEKLGTAIAVLTAYGPAHRFTTSAALDATGHTVTLIGSGDPSLTSADLAALAQHTAAELKARNTTSVNLTLDDTLFPGPTLAPGWLTGYYPRTVAPVRALDVDRREAGDTSLDAAQIFAQQLQTNGIATTTITRAAAPAKSATLATVTGQPLAMIINHMLQYSNNDDAEHLFLLAAVAAHKPATWSNAAAAVRASLTTYAIPLAGTSIYDGSGLSRADRVPAQTLVAELRTAANPANPNLQPIITSLPVAGKTGSLAAGRGRFTIPPASCATGKLTGKTGHLTGAVVLAGIAQAADGTRKTYAFEANQVNPTPQTKNAIDGLAATLTGCW
jgi:D-alanyl-D-alanine carboxypeptidase/D-alanyl-D-alanine-endopeptidase (penicillin-binding protein 4)